jgi:hypothetical protein
MAKSNYLAQIKSRMTELQKEYNALTEAYQLLSTASGTRGRKAASPSLGDVSSVPSSYAPKKKGKRGRPAGAKNKAAGKAPKVAAPKAAKGKPGRPKAAKAAKAAKVAKPGKTGKRSRIPNLSVKIQEMVAKSGRFMTNSQITDRLASLYPNKPRTDLGKYISVILANMKSRKELNVVTVDDKGNRMRSGLWGLTNWFDGQKPKSEFLK